MVFVIPSEQWYQTEVFITQALLDFPRPDLLKPAVLKFIGLLLHPVRFSLTHPGSFEMQPRAQMC